MDYHFAEDVKAIREILGVTQAGLAEGIGTQQVTLSRSETGRTKPSDRLLEYVYGFAYEKNIRLGQLKEMLCRERIEPGHRLLFYGAGNAMEINSIFSISETTNNIGQNLCAVENYEQAVSDVIGYRKSSVCYLDFDEQDLKCKKYSVNRGWILTHAYYHGGLEQYESHPLIQKLIEESQSVDYLIEPTVDNRMFQIINEFISGEITDEQCRYCLAAANPENRYVFTTEAARKNLKILERNYISAIEKEYYRKSCDEEKRLVDEQVKAVMIKYRGKGRYINEILK